MNRNKKYSPYANIIHRLIFSNRCKVCMKVIPIKDEFCKNCDVEKFRIDKSKIDARSYTNYKFDKHTSPFSYEGEIKTSILNLKYKHFKRAADFLSDEMIKVLQRDFKNEEIDLITCIPMTKYHLKERQLNHGKALLKRISKSFNLKPLPHLILKIKETPSQVGLGYKQRLTNLKDAFVVNPKYDIKGKTILICDDVITTGSTLNECTKALKKAGAKRIVCVTAAINEKKN